MVKERAMRSNERFPAVFLRLKDLLLPFAPHLLVTTDGPTGYSLNTPYAEQYKKELFFGAVQIKKNYVSYYLMPVYVFPDLLGDLSPRLKKRMQGKSCFNFTNLDGEIVAELARLTERGFERFRAGRLV
jgi:hypothetical protein